MFYIDQTAAGFLNAKDEHYRCLRYIIKKKLMGKSFTEAHPKNLSREIKKVNGIHSSISSFLNDEQNLEDVLIGSPEILNKIKSKFRTTKQKASIRALFRYDGFTKKEVDETFGFYNAYHLAENLDMQTCVYCNRLYTTTIITAKREFVARATFDHWFPKSTYPLLALSFYNLVPSCNVCNSSVKGSDNYSIAKVFHPYFKSADVNNVLDLRFSYTLENYLNAQSKIVPNNPFTKLSLKVMKLDEMYATHKDEIRELISLKKAYSDAYLSSLQNMLNIDLSPEEIYRLAFGVYLEDQNLIRRPLSKLKKDILIELGMIK